MIMADVLTWFFIVLGLYVTLVCHWLGAAALFPKTVAACRDRYARPVSAVFLGLVLALPLLVLGAAGAKAPNPPVAGFSRALLVVLILPALLGSAGLALRLGAGLASPIDDTQPWRRSLRGSVVLAGMFLLPLAGWFVVLPLVLVSGFGALASVLHRRPWRHTASEPSSQKGDEPTPAGGGEGSATAPWKTV
jgi:hypothetical protein